MDKLLTGTSATVRRSRKNALRLSGIDLYGAIWYIAGPIVIVAYCLPTALKISDAAHAVLILLYVTVCAVGVIDGFVSGARIVQITYFGFSLVWSGIPVVYQLASDTPAWRDYSLYSYRGVVTQALLIHLLSACAVLLAIRLARLWRRPIFVAPVRRLRRPIMPASVLYVGIAIAITPVVLSVSGGISAMFTSRDTLKDELRNSGVIAADSSQAMLGFLKILPGSLALSAAILVIAHMQMKDRARGRRAWWKSEGAILTLGLSLGLCVLYLNPLTNTRFVSAGAVICLLLAAIRPRGRKGGLILGAFIVLGFQALYPLANMFRSSESLRAGPQFDPRGFSGPDYDGFQQIVNTLLYTQDYGHTYGAHLLSGVLFFVPRSIWTGKMYPASLDIAEARGYDFTNLSEPLHAELYLEFGLVPMLALMAIVGVIISRIDIGWLGSPGSALAIIAPYVAVAQYGLLRGPFGSLAPVYLSTMILLVLGLALTQRSRTGRS